MYVGMTRAEETLRLLKIPKNPNPFLKEIRGNFVMQYTYQETVETDDAVGRRYEMLGLSDIFMDYAGGFPRTHAIHKQLAKLETGQIVFLRRKNGNLEIQNQGGRCLGRLSSKGVNKWTDHLDQILEARVVGIIQRNRDDPDEAFQEFIRTDKWEMPVLELVLANPA